MAENLALKIILSAKDKASAALDKLRGGSSSLARAFSSAESELKKLENTQKKLTAFKKAGTDLRQLNQALDANRQCIKQLSNEMKAAKAPTSAQISEMKKLGQQNKGLSLKQTAARISLKQLGNELNQAGFNTKKMSTQQKQLSMDMQKATAESTKQRMALKRLNEAQAKHNKMKSTQSKMLSSSGMTFAKGSIATGVLGAGLKAPMEFEESFSKVTALTRLDKNNKQDKPKIDMLRKQAIDLGATTSFTSSEVADGQGYLAMTGFTAEQIQASMGPVLSMTKAAGMDMGRVADISSDIAGGFSISPDEMRRVADVLTLGFTTSNTTLETFGESMKYVGPIASGAGQDFETMAASVGLLGSAGIKGSEAGTALRSMLTRLAGPPAMASKAMAKLGLKAKDAAGNMRPLTDILSDAAEKTKNLGTGDRLEYFKRIFGVEAATAAMKLIEHSGEDGIRKYAETLKNSAGTADKVADIMADNLAGDLKNMASAWEAMSISVFDQNSGMLRDLTTDITNVLRSINMWVQENPRLASTIFKVVAGGVALMTVVGAIGISLATLLGPIAVTRFAFSYLMAQGGMAAKVLGLLPKTLGLVGSAFGLLKTGILIAAKAIMVLGRALLMNPIGLAITAIAVAGFLIYKYWEPIKVWLGSFWEGIKAKWAPIGEWINGLWQQITGFFKSGIGNISATIINWSPYGLFYQAFASVLSWFGIELPAKFTGFGSMLIDGLINGIKAGWSKFKSFWNDKVSYLPDTFAKKMEIHSPSRVMKSMGGHVMSGLSLGINNGTQGLINTFSQATDFLNPDRHANLISAGSAAVLTAGSASSHINRSNHDQIEININLNGAAASQALELKHEIAAAVKQAMRERDQKNARAARSSMKDKD